MDGCRRGGRGGFELPELIFFSQYEHSTLAGGAISITVSYRNSDTQ